MNNREWAELTGVAEETQRRYLKQGYCPYPRRTESGRAKDPAYGCWENMVFEGKETKSVIIKKELKDEL